LWSLIWIGSSFGGRRQSLLLLVIPTLLVDGLHVIDGLLQSVDDLLPIALLDGISKIAGGLNPGWVATDRR